MAVICTGLSPLLNLCASSIITKGTTIYYLLYHNGYDETKYLSYDPFANYLANEIAGFFGYKLVIVGPLNWYCPPREKRLFDPIRFDPPQLPLDEHNIITSNALFFLYDQLRGKRIDIFPEGASCFGNQFVSFDSTLIQCFDHFRETAKHIRSLITGSPFVLDKYWILPDISGQIRLRSKYIISNISVLPENILFPNIRSLALHIASIIPDLNFKHLPSPFFHPLIEPLSFEQYSSWFSDLSILIKDTPIFIKTRPRDIRPLPDYFNSPNFILMPRKYGQLPAELVIFQTSMRYLGYYSSIMLAFKRSDIFLVAPPDNIIARDYSHIYKGLSNAINIRSSSELDPLHLTCRHLSP
ncbi:putative conserved secreted protein [Synechococcus sp. Minos11]|uniref:hypothetical protein n=1 Tax=Synechococcus sp. Minos11 TaxID=221341 RepID=UPI0016470436|nr:hypothetical protein [Synechococcus sp. Minos11]QNJ07692.1 putative conserved secreted protein [Synechococcus sp. Minos11]